MFTRLSRGTRRLWMEPAYVWTPAWRTPSFTPGRALLHQLARNEPPPNRENVQTLPTELDDNKWVLSDLDVVSPNTLVTSFLVYKTHPDVNVQRVIESVTYGLDQAAEQLPTLKAQIHFESSGKPRKQLTKGTLKLHTRTFELWEHRSFEELAERNFMPSDFQQPRLVPVQSYDKTGKRPVLLVQLNLIPGGMILALGLNHVASDGGARNLALKLICNSSKAHMEGTSAQHSKFHYQRSAFSARPELLALPREQLHARIKDYAIFETTKALQSPPGGVLPSRASIYRIEGGAVNRLKTSCKPAKGVMYLSSYDCIAGLLWRSVMRARCESKPYLKGGESRTLCPVDLRGRGISDNYFGNAVNVASAGPVRMMDLLGRDGQSIAASSIRRAIENTSIASLAEVTALGTMMKPTEKLQFMPRHGLLEDDFMISNWHFMETIKYDFGIGPPAAVRMPAMPAPGFAFVFPDCQQQQKSRIYDVYMTLPEAEQDFLSRDEEFRTWFRTVS